MTRDPLPPSQSGLGSQEARRLLAAEGPNTLPDPERRGLPGIALDVLREPMFLLLSASALLYLAIGSTADAAILLGSLAVVLAITVSQTIKSERSLEALRDLASPRALVVRDGRTQRIAGREVVRGDLLVLNEGDRIPADARIEDTAAFMVDESLLTGESLPLAKQAGDPVFSGTLVTKGQAYALTTATGRHTAFGRIGDSLASLRRERTHLEIETARLVKLFAAGALAACLALAAAVVARQGDWLHGLLSGLTLAMALIPEEFPVVLTIFLALGAWRIARHGVLTRRMPAIEMLGATTVLCVDKTGTLTENRMTVAEVIGDGENRGAIVQAAAMACERDPFDPMERAILAEADGATAAARGQAELLASHPLSSDFFAVCQVWALQDGARRAYIKGAVETVLPLCGADDVLHRRVATIVAESAARGYRLLAVAEADAGDPLPDAPTAFAWRWLGLIAFSDPLRGEVPGAVAQCHRAGMRVVMITGDHPATALAIAKQAGIASGDAVLSGADIDCLDDAALASSAKRCNVFARIAPEQKLRLVNALKAAGEIVAMTGDGVNDAPALKAAHIGIAMGKRGTDVAREAAMLVLLEDDFASLVEAVRQGRRIYANIRNAMRYIIAVHVPIVGMAFLPLAFGWPVLLLPVHVVFLELVIDPACTIVFEAEAEDDAMMRHPPRSAESSLFAPGMLAGSLLYGLAALAAVVAAYAWAVEAGLGDGPSRALGFAAIVMANLAMMHAMRSPERVFVAWRSKPNPALWWIGAGALAALAAAIYIPSVAAIFRFGPLGADALGVALLAGIFSVLGVEWHKFQRAREHPAGT